MFCDEKYIDLPDGIKLYSQIREGGHKKWIVALHGLGEHLDRHQYINDLFSGKFNIAQFDLRGHGKSQGKRGAVSDFRLFSEDLIAVIDFLKKNMGMESYFLFGHSMGALICSDFVQNYSSTDNYPERIFLSNPPVGLPGFAGSLFHLAPNLVTDNLRKLGVGFNVGGQLDIKKLSHDINVYQQYVSDPLTILKPHTSLILNLVHATKRVFSKPLRATCPIFCGVATEDALVNSDYSIYFFKHLEKACVLKVFEGAYHEMHNEEPKWRDPYFEFLKRSFALDM